MDILHDLKENGRSISNHPVPCFDELFVTKRKKFEGRSGSKRLEWKLAEQPVIKFYDKDNPTRYAICKTVGFILYTDPGQAFDYLGSNLMPGRTREQVVEFYYKTLQLEEDIKTNGFTAIKLQILEVHGI